MRSKTIVKPGSKQAFHKFSKSFWEKGKVSKLPRDFPVRSSWGDTKAVCKRCHCVMNDLEPASPRGEFLHPAFDKDLKPRKCVNAGKTFNMDHLEIEPFVKKSRRRFLKRNKIRA